MLFQAIRFAATAIALSVAVLLSGCGGGGGSAGVRPPTGDSTPTFTSATSADVVPALIRVLRAADSLLVSDVLDFSEDPPVRGQTTCSGVRCYAHTETPNASWSWEWDYEIGEGSLPPSVEILPPSLEIEVAERRGVSLFRASGPYVDEDDVPYEDDWYVEFGGWLDYSFFLVEADVYQTTGRLNEGVSGESLGRATGTNPLSGGAAWNGVIVGIDVSASTAQGNAIQGDADLTISDFTDPKLDIEFTNIRDTDAGRPRSDMTWNDVPLTNGGFGTGPDGNSIEGKFYGPNHEEVGGVFERDQVIGAFGAARGAGR